MPSSNANMIVHMIIKFDPATDERPSIAESYRSGGRNRFDRAFAEQRVERLNEWYVRQGLPEAYTLESCDPYR